MDLFFPLDGQTRQEFKASAIQIGFEEPAAECTAHLHMLEPHDRIAVLVLAWSKIGDYLTHNQYAPCVGTAVNWIGRYTLNLWFGRDWIACSNEIKISLIENMMKVYPAAYITMHPFSWPYMFSIYRDPWMVAYLNANFQRYNGRMAPDDDVEPKGVLDAKDIEFLQQEGIALVILRLVNMFDFNMIQLVKHICLRLLWLWEDQIASRPIRATPNSSHYMDCTRHIYLIAVCESNGNNDLNYLFEYIQRSMQCNTAEPGTLQDAAQTITKGLQENNTTLMEFLNAFLVQCPDIHSTNIFGCAIAKYTTFVTEYLLRKLHSLSLKQLFLSHDKFYVSLVQIFIKQRESSEELIQTTAALSEKLFSAVHNLEFLKLAYEEVKSRTRPEWYTTKLTILTAIISEELNKLEQQKYTEDQLTDELIANEKQLATFYCDLSKLLVKVPYLEQECWLTTFSLYPCKEYLECVTKCGTRNLRAIKKQASKLYLTIDLKPKRPAKIIKEEPVPVTVKEETATNPLDIIAENNTNTAGLVIPKQEPITDVCPKALCLPDLNKPLETNAESCKGPVALSSLSYPPETTISEPCTSAAFLESLAKVKNPETNDAVTAEIKCEPPPKSTPKKRGPKPNNNRKTENSKAIKAKGRGVSNGKPNLKYMDRKKAKEERALKSLIVKAIIAKPDDKDKDSAEFLFSAAAGASDVLSKQTKESIKYPAFALINSVTDTEDLIKFTNYDNEVVQYHELNRVLSNLRLKNSEYDDILALIISPRYKRLTWAICWKILRKRCRELLTKEPKKRQLVQQCMADANNRLTHLDIDYDKYKDKPQIDYGTIEGGYECFETESGEELKPIVVGTNPKGSAKKPGARARRPKLVADLFTEITRTKLSSPIFLSKPLYICCRSDSKSPRLGLSVCPISPGSSIVPPQRSPIPVISSDTNLTVGNTTPSLHPQQRTLLEILTSQAAPMNSRTHSSSFSGEDPSTSSAQPRRTSISQQLLNLLSSGCIQMQPTISCIPSTPVSFGAKQQHAPTFSDGNQENPNSMPVQQDTMQSTSTSILQQQLSKPSTSRQAYLESSDNKPKDLIVDKCAVKQKHVALSSCADSTTISEATEVTVTDSLYLQPVDQQINVGPPIQEIENDDSLDIDATLLSELIPSTASNTIQLRQELGITSSMLNSIYPPVNWHETLDGKKIIDCTNQDPRVVLCLVEAAIANSTKPISVSFARFNMLLAKWKEMWPLKKAAAFKRSLSEGHNKPIIIDDVMLSKDNEYTISATHMDMISSTAFSKVQKSKQQRKRQASVDVKEIKRPRVQKPRNRPVETVISISPQPANVVVRSRKPRKPATTKRIKPCDTTVVTVEPVINELRQEKSAESSNENVSTTDEAVKAAEPTVALEVKSGDTLPINDEFPKPTPENVNDTSVHSDAVETQAIDCTFVDRAEPEVTEPIKANTTVADSPFIRVSVEFKSTVKVSVEVLDEQSPVPIDANTVESHESKLRMDTTIVPANADAPAVEHETESVDLIPDEVLLETTAPDNLQNTTEVESSEIDNERVMHIAVLVNTFKEPSNDNGATTTPPSGAPTSPAHSIIEPPESATQFSLTTDDTTALNSGGRTTDTVSVSKLPAIKTIIEATAEIPLVSLDLVQPTHSISEISSPTVFADVDSVLPALEVREVQEAIEEAADLSVAPPGELFDTDSLAIETGTDDQSVSTSEAIVSSVADIPHVMPSPEALVTTSESAFEIHTSARRLETTTCEVLAPDTTYAEPLEAQSASSMDDVLHDEGKVLNNNLLHPQLKTYGSSRGAFKFEKQPTTSNSNVAKVSDITIATTISCTITKNSISTNTSSSTANIDRCTGATPSQLIMPYPFDVVTSLLFQHANANDNSLSSKEPSMLPPGPAVLPSPSQENTKFIMEGMACKLKHQFIQQHHELLNMNLDNPDDDVAVILFGRLLLDGDEQTISSFPNKNVCLDLEISAPKFSSSNIQTELSINLGEPEHRAHIVKLTMSGKTKSKVELSTLLNEFARSRLRAGSPTIYSPAVSLKEVKSGKSQSSFWLRDNDKDHFKWMQGTERSRFLSSTQNTQINIKRISPCINTGATSSTVAATVTGEKTATPVLCSKCKCSDFGDNQDIVAVSSSALEFDDIFSDVNEEDIKREHSCHQEAANDNNVEEDIDSVDKQQGIGPNKNLLACRHTASEKANDTHKEERIACTDSAFEEIQAVDNANLKKVTCTDSITEEANDNASKELISCTDPASEEIQAIGTANKEMIVFTDSAFKEIQVVDTANKEMVACTDNVLEEVNDNLNKEMIACTDSASEEIQALVTTNMVTFTDSASDKTTRKKIALGLAKEQTNPDNEDYNIKKTLTEIIDTKQEIPSQTQAVVNSFKENTTKNEVSKNKLDEEYDVPVRESLEYNAVKQKAVISLQRKTEQDDKEQDSERLEIDETETLCEKEVQELKMEERQYNSDQEKSRQPSVAFSSDRDSPSTSFAAALKRENRKLAIRKSAPVRKAFTRNVERKMRQKVKVREEDYYECAMQSTANDSDDDAGSDYVPRKRRSRVVRPMKLRCIRRSYVAELATESSSCSSTAPARRNKRVFASKSTSKRQVTSRCSIRKSRLASTPRLTANERAAFERYNCRELQVVISTLTAKDADLWCRKSRVVLFRHNIEEENSLGQEDVEVPIDFECPVVMEVDADDECGPDEDPLSVNDQADENHLPEDALKSKLRLIIPYPLPAPASESSEESEEEEDDEKEEEEDIALDPPKTSSSDSSDDDDDDASSGAPIGYRLTWGRNRNTGRASIRASTYDNTADENRVSSTTDDAELEPEEKSDENNNSSKATSKLIDIPNQLIDIAEEMVTNIPFERVYVAPLTDKIKIPIFDFGHTFSVAVGAGAGTPQIRTAFQNREYFYSNAPTLYNSVTSSIRTFNSLPYVAGNHVHDEGADSDDKYERIRNSGRNSANTNCAINVGTGSAGASYVGAITPGTGSADASTAGTSSFGASSTGSSNAGASSTRTSYAESSSAGVSSAGASYSGLSNAETGSFINLRNTAENTSLNNNATVTGDTDDHTVNDIDNEAECITDEKAIAPLNAAVVLNTTEAINTLNTERNVEDVRSDLITNTISTALENSAAAAPTIYVTQQSIMDCANKVKWTPNDKGPSSDRNSSAGNTNSAVTNQTAATSNTTAPASDATGATSNTAAATSGSSSTASSSLTVANNLIVAANYTTATECESDPNAAARDANGILGRTTDPDDENIAAVIFALIEEIELSSGNSANAAVPFFSSSSIQRSNEYRNVDLTTVVGNPNLNSDGEYNCNINDPCFDNIDLDNEVKCMTDGSSVKKIPAPSCVIDNQNKNSTADNFNDVADITTGVHTEALARVANHVEASTQTTDFILVSSSTEREGEYRFLDTTNIQNDASVVGDINQEIINLDDSSSEPVDEWIPYENVVASLETIPANHLAVSDDDAIYINSDKDEEGSLNVGANIDPIDFARNIVAHMHGCDKITDPLDTSRNSDEESESFEDTEYINSYDEESRSGSDSCKEDHEIDKETDATGDKNEDSKISYSGETDKESMSYSLACSDTENAVNDNNSSTSDTHKETDNGGSHGGENAGASAMPRTSTSVGNRCNIHEAPRSSAIRNTDDPSLVNNDYRPEIKKDRNTENNWNTRNVDGHASGSSTNLRNPQQQQKPESRQHLLHENRSNNNPIKKIRFTPNEGSTDNIYEIFEPDINNLEPPEILTLGAKVCAHYVSPFPDNTTNVRDERYPTQQIPQHTKHGTKRMPLNYVLAFIRQDMIPLLDHNYLNANGDQEPAKKLKEIRPSVEISPNNKQKSFIAHVHQKILSKIASHNAPSTNHQPPRRSRLRTVHELPPDIVNDWNQQFDETLRNNETGTAVREEQTSPDDDHPYALRFPWLDPQWGSF